MSHRPIKEKQLNRLRRALRKGRLPARIDLVQWLEDHGHAQTAGEARKLILAGRVRSESHPVGVHIVDLDDGSKIRLLDALVPAKFRPTLHVVPVNE